MGFDLAKIASELHLTTPVVEALEADDFQKVGARVFVRGYLRNYARVVGMPVESVLRQFDEKWPDDGADHSMVRESPTLPADGGPSRGWAGAMTWLMILGLVVLFLMWWRGYLDEIVPEQIRSSSIVDQAGSPVPLVVEDETAPGLPLDGMPLLEDGDGGLRLPPRSPEEPAETEPADVDLVTPPAPAATDAVDPAPPETTGVTLAPAADAPPSPSPAVAETPSDTAVLPASASDGGAPVVDATRQIVLDFNAACWVDVRDSTRKFKLFGEMPKGVRKVLGGEPPYKMVIGNAGAVSITVNGTPFDLTPYAKGNVARFTLEP